MKVFITGVAGFLGSHLADAMIAEGHNVVGVDNLIGGELDNVPSKVDFHQFDCNDFNHIQRVSDGCDIYYHCAATAYEGLSVFSPHFVTQNIVGASVAIFSAAIANRAKRIVFCSSMARYGRSSPPSPRTRNRSPRIPTASASSLLSRFCAICAPPTELSM